MKHCPQYCPVGVVSAGFDFFPCLFSNFRLEGKTIFLFALYQVIYENFCLFYPSVPLKIFLIPVLRDTHPSMVTGKSWRFVFTKVFLAIISTGCLYSWIPVKIDCFLNECLQSLSRCHQSSAAAFTRSATFWEVSCLRTFCLTPFHFLNCWRSRIRSSEIWQPASAM